MTEREVLRKGHRLVALQSGEVLGRTFLEEVRTRPEGKQLRGGGRCQEVEVTMQVALGNSARKGAWGEIQREAGKWVFLNTRGSSRNGCGWRKKPMESKRLKSEEERNVGTEDRAAEGTRVGRTGRRQTLLSRGGPFPLPWAGKKGTCGEKLTRYVRAGGLLPPLYAHRYRIWKNTTNRHSHKRKRAHMDKF